LSESAPGSELSVRLGDKPLENHDQYFFNSKLAVIFLT
jgi:hypothetical protein